MQLSSALSFLLTSVLLAGIAGPSWGSAITKTCRTTVTDEEIATARENIAKYDWAKGILDNLKNKPFRGAWCDIGKTADQLLEIPDEQLWELMPDTRIHREYYVNQHKGCPVHGIEIKKFDTFHPWRVDPFNKPYKIQCPVGGEWYPSNDFAKGDLTSGDFSDAGQGFKRGQDTFFFLGEYIHIIYLQGVRPALSSLAQLYVLTGDRRYAHKAAILLLRLAEQFPNSTDKKDRCYKGPYAPNSGLITDYIWSCSDVAGIAQAYDQIFDAMDDPEVLAFASGKIPAIKTGSDFRAYVDENIVRVGAQALMDRVIIGNQGMHQRSAATIALVMDDIEGRNKPDSRDLMEWVYSESSGPLRTFAQNSLLKDGGSAESTGYNSSRLAMLSLLEPIEKLRARHPEAFPTSRYPSLWKEPKFLAMANYFTDMVMLDRYFPCIGDSPSEGIEPSELSRSMKSRLGSYAELYLRQTGDEQFAPCLINADGSVAHWSIYQKPLDEQVKRAVQKQGEFPKRAPTLLDGSGIAIARSGEGDNERAMWIHYGASRGHGHRDYLNLGLDAKSLPLIPELGYPKSWDFAKTWESNVLTHNTVTIGRQPLDTVHDIGRLLAFQTVPGISLFDAQQDPYRTDDRPFGEPERLYRRTSMLIDLGPQDSYVADIFRVRGGSEHWLSWHGPAVPSSFEGPSMIRQEKGTLAGEDVEYNTPRKGSDGQPLLDVFAMFGKVERGAATAPYSLDYDCGGKNSVHLRVTGLPEPGTELVTADGRPPSDPNAYTVRYAFACRKGDAPLESQFISVLEPYSGKRIVDHIESLQLTGKALDGYRPAGIQVTAGAIEDTILTTGTVSGSAILDSQTVLRGDTGLIRRENGKLTRLFVSGGTRISTNEASLSLNRAEITGKIETVNRKADEVVVAMETSSPSALVGRRIRIHNERRSVAYQIREAKPEGAGRVRLKLSTTSLLAEGVADGFGDGVIQNHVMMDYAGLRWVGGKWHNACSSYTGGTLENESGTASLRILGVRSDGQPEEVKWDVILAPESAPAAADLKTMLADSDADGHATFRLYDYGIGDELTIPGLASLSATGPDSYALETTDDAVLMLPCAEGKTLSIRKTSGGEWIPLGASHGKSITVTIPLSVSGGSAELGISN